MTNKYTDKSEDCELSIIMPCLNEELTVGICIEKAKEFLFTEKIHGEIIVADNGSTDDSRKIARESGAKVILIKRKGYGSALRGGIEAANGKYIIMGDADDSYDFICLRPFLEKLCEGYDLVMGNRFLGGIKTGAMPPLHKFLGNPILSGIGRLFFKTPARDFHCGLRGFKKDSAIQMDLQTTGMEFASEMVIKASLLEMNVCQVPTTLYPDGRDRPPHLRSWRDGWRHLRFMLLYSPSWLFFYPGIFVFVIGMFFSVLTYVSPITIKNISFDMHYLAYFNALIVIGFNMVLFAVQSILYGYRSGLLPGKTKLSKIYKFINLERGLIIGGGMILMGILMGFGVFFYWASVQFGDIQPQSIMDIVIPSVSIIIMGTQVVFSSFFLSILDMPITNIHRQSDIK